MTSEIRYVVLPAAGYGVRMTGLTRGQPKELLNIREKPAIFYPIWAAAEAGVEKAVIVIRKGKEVIHRVLSDLDYGKGAFPDGADALDRLRHAIDFEFVYQKEPRGECDAVSYAGDILNKEPFLVIYPDNHLVRFTEILTELLSEYSIHRHDTILLKRNESTEMANGSGGHIDLEPIDGKHWRITTFYPKMRGNFGSQSGYKVSGLYVATPHFLDFIRSAQKRTGSGEITDGMVRADMRQKGIEFIGVDLADKMFDIGSPRGYRSCIRYLDNE